ncbi:hypothetical protein JCM11641_007846 [Rhodosporidiobolus odoratus]
MDSAPREADRQNPVQIARMAQSVIARSIEQELSPSDRLIAHQAEAKLMSHARVGFWLGSFAGGAFAFRSRWSAGRDALRKGALPRLFFPSAKEGKGSLREQIEAAKKAASEDAKAGAKAAEDSMREGRGRFFAKAFGFGILGSVIGTQVGVWSGRSASNRFLENSGRKDAIHESMQRGLRRATQELANMPVTDVVVKQLPHMTATGMPLGDEFGRRGGKEAGAGSAIDGVGYEEPGRELEHGALSDGVGYSDRAPPQDHSPGSLADPSIPSNSYGSSSSTSSPPSGPSRWDQLRQSRAAPPSRWDELRQERARASVPPSSSSSSSSSADEQPNDRSERELMAMRDSQAERERKRQEFDALFEKEAKGGDDSMGDKAWK